MLVFPAKMTGLFTLPCEVSCLKSHKLRQFLRPVNFFYWQPVSFKKQHIGVSARQLCIEQNIKRSLWTFWSRVGQRYFNRKTRAIRFFGGNFFKISRFLEARKILDESDQEKSWKCKFSNDLSDIALFS